MAKLPPHIKVARAALRKAITLKTWKREGVTLRATMFRLVDVGEDSYASGFAGYYGGTIKVGGESTDAFIQQLIVHELAHTCLKKAGLCDRHGPRFQGLMRAASCEFFGLTNAEVVPLWNESKEFYKNSGEKHAYQLDWVIAKLVHERTGGSPRDREREEKARARGRAEIEKQELKRQATKIADAEGWGRAWATGGSVHTHRYIGDNDEEFACGHRFDEYGPHSGWPFIKPNHETSFRITCLKCVKAILKAREEAA